LTSVGWIGLGKLGAPCAAALAHYGDHVVWGYDVRGVEPTDYDWSSLPPVELTDSIDKVVAETDDVVFVAVQTPHAPRYGGEQPTPPEPRDFEYRYLVSAVRDVCRAAEEQRKNVTLVVVSTVLPGTFDRYLRPLLNRFVTPVYHPFFIAMGTVVEDFIEPEMVLFGADDPTHTNAVYALYEPIHIAVAPTMSVASAELAKVAYNTFISMKIVYANALAELCEATGADVDDVVNALRCATDRVISGRYLAAGMGDGGACHPRDNVALSALARRHGVSVDLMGFLNDARERHAGWLASLVQHWQELTGLPVVLLGRSYKPNVNMTDGSPALLLSHVLWRRHVTHTHVERRDQLDPEVLPLPAVYFVATKHDEFRNYTWPRGSVVIDPFGYLTSQEAVTLVTPGRKR
jgi:UDPglucose 6-dehydrogenase